MKLNLDCMRDVLLVLEDAPFQKEMNLGEITGAIAIEYPFEDIAYSVQKLSEAGYIITKSKAYVTGSTIVSVQDITYNGHQFLANIRTNKVWSATKSVMSKIGTTSIQAATQIATSVVTELIKNAILPSL